MFATHSTRFYPVYCFAAHGIITAPILCKRIRSDIKASILRSEWPCRMRAAHNMSLASARNTHPPTWGKDDISKRVVNVVGAATIAHCNLAQYNSNKLNRCRHRFSGQEETGGNAGGSGSRQAEDTHAATVLGLRLNFFRSRCAHWRQQVRFSTRHFEPRSRGHVVTY